MKHNTNRTKRRRILPILLLCLALLAGCAKSAGGNAGGGKNDGGNAGGGSESAGYSAENAPFEEKTPEAINGKDEKSGQETDAGSVDIASAVKDSIFSGPEGSVPPEALRPDNDFAGLFRNDAYAAAVIKDENGEMRVTIVSVSGEPAAAEWTMRGYFSDENCRIRYTDAVKSLVTYGAGGVETGRETEYENGSGTIRFSDPDHFLWDDNTEPIEKNVFQRVDPAEGR